MSDATVTNTTISALNTNVTFNTVSATEDTAGTAQTFNFTKTKKGSKIVLILNDNSTAAIKPVTYSITAGDLFASNAITGTIGTSTAAGISVALQIDDARVVDSDGVIAVVVTPGGSTAGLTTAHAFSMSAIELL